MQFDCCFHMPFDCWHLEVVSYLIIISYCLKRRRFYRSESFIGRCLMDFSMEMVETEAGYIELPVQLG
jgi:hypothetical protein